MHMVAEPKPSINCTPHTKHGMSATRNPSTMLGLAATPTLNLRAIEHAAALLCCKVCRYSSTTLDKHDAISSSEDSHQRRADASLPARFTSLLPHADKRKCQTAGICRNLRHRMQT
eukprot:GHRQ01003762.1.p4 GENE.GHRQ01003762.1~~GHRQ01003762.1.p4  ORF type:complete len:116 (-),score=20.64 GHRQ01003762.1:895-1242(-)